MSAFQDLKLARCPRSLAPTLVVPPQRDRSSHSLHSDFSISAFQHFSSQPFRFSAFSFWNHPSPLATPSVDTNMKNFITDSFQRTITKDQSKDTGMAMVLLLLLVSGSFRHQVLIAVAIITLVVTMVHPQIYRPIAVVWLGGTHLIGTLVSKVLLTVVFFGVVAPIGLARKLLGIDSLRL